MTGENPARVLKGVAEQWVGRPLEPEEVAMFDEAAARCDAPYFNWQPTGRKNGVALPQDDFADVWAVTFREGFGWVIVKNRQDLPWLFFKTQRLAMDVVEASILGEANAPD